MISKGIRIYWDSSIEYIGIDLDDLENVSPITNTIEWWKSEKEWVKYNTKFKLRRFNDGSIEITLAYEEGNNPHLVPADICFGHATVRLSSGQVDGKATWDGAEDSGTSKWERVDIPLVGERKRETVSRIQRDQAIYRGALIAVDECCVLTGEKTVEALEAAHIIPAKDGGADVIENGILLRADIHKLFDAGLFSINTKGKVSIKTEIGKSYSDALSGKKIPRETFYRVRAALEKKQIQRERLTIRCITN